MMDLRNRKKNDLAQPSVSHHIKALIEAGLTIPEQTGHQYTYLLNRNLYENFLRRLQP
jgi:ArsR family transcriptional regulator